MKMLTALKIVKWVSMNYVGRETHLEYTVCYVSSEGRNRWTSGNITFATYKDADILLQDVLSFMTPFVQQQCIRVEVCLPNRDHYRNLRSGYIKDTGILLAIKEL